jgi:hypothetical protein
MCRKHLKFSISHKLWAHHVSLKALAMFFFALGLIFIFISIFFQTSALSIYIALFIEVLGIGAWKLPTIFEARGGPISLDSQTLFNKWFPAHGSSGLG